MTGDLLARANRLERLAKLAQDSEGDKLNLERVKLATDKLSNTLDQLSGVLAARHSLDELGVPRAIEPDVTAVYLSLRDFITARGRPKPDRLQRANTAVARQIDEIETDSRSRWTNWTGAALKALPAHKTAALPEQDRLRVDRQIRSLEATARLMPSVTQISTFKSVLWMINEELGEIELSEPVLRVLELFTSGASVALSDISDADIAALRSDPSVEAQFVIRRQA